MIGKRGHKTNFGSPAVEERTRIFLVIGDFATAASGPTAAVKRLASWLVENGHDVAVVGTWARERPPLSELVRDYGPAKIVMHRRLFKDSWHLAPSALWLAAKLSVSRKPFVVDVHGVWLFNGVILSLAALIRGQKFFVILAGNLRPVAMEKSRISKAIALRVLFRWWLTRAACVIALNDTEAGEAHQIVPSARLTVIPNAVKPESKALTAYRNNEALFLGRIDPIKNLESLIHAFITVHRDFPSWHLRIVGPASAPEYLEKLRLQAQRENHDDWIVFDGPAYGEQKEAFLLSSSVFVLSSWSEGQPVAALEAMAHGLPVIVSDQCNLDIPESCGRVCGCDVESIASALRNIFSLSAQERAMMGRAAFKFARELFSEDAVFTRRLELYRHSGQNYVLSPAIANDMDVRTQRVSKRPRRE